MVTVREATRGREAAMGVARVAAVREAVVVDAGMARARLVTAAVMVAVAEATAQLAALEVANDIHQHHRSEATS